MITRAIVLAAGRGTHMKSSLPKVLHEVAGRTLLGWCLDALNDLDEVVVVVGHGAVQVMDQLPDGVGHVIQEPQLGTGHAAEVGLGALGPAGPGTVLVTPADMPLIRRSTITALLEAHIGSGAAATILTARVEDPTGYGRIVRDDDGAVVGIVEHGDADDGQRSIDEINTSVYAFESDALDAALGSLRPDNAQKERYLTDVIGILVAGGARVGAVQAPPGEALGVNSHAELAEAAAELRRRINEAWMGEGVAMEDPARVYLDADVQLAAGVTIYPDVHLERATSVGQGATIGPGVFASGASIGARARVLYSVLTDVVVGDSAAVGPYAHLRPGTHLGERAKAGSFVELKGSTVGSGAKVPHLAYVGDADIGDGANIGAGVITVNYDGFEKHRTVVGPGARIGSATMLVAPVEVGEDAYTGAGSVITKDVEPGALAVARSPQRQYPGYAARRQRRASREGS